MQHIEKKPKIPTVSSDEEVGPGCYLKTGPPCRGVCCSVNEYSELVKPPIICCEKVSSEMQLQTGFWWQTSSKAAYTSVACDLLHSLLLARVWSIAFEKVKSNTG